MPKNIPNVQEFQKNPSPQSSPRRERRQNLRPKNLNNQRILIVDDEERLRKALKKILLEEGYQAFAVESCEKALEEVKKNGFDLIIADLVMPGMNGIPLLKEVKKISPSCKAIIITAYGSYETAQEAVKLGVYDYIEKPFSLGSLKTTIKKALTQEENQEENIHRIFSQIEKKSTIQDRVNTIGKQVKEGVTPFVQDSLVVIEKAAFKVKQKAIPLAKNSLIALEQASNEVAKKIVSSVKKGIKKSNERRNNKC